MEPDGSGRASRMKELASATTIGEQDELISQAMEKDETRLRRFIRRRVSDAGDAEDILQEVFFELISTYRLMEPVEQVSAWLFRVARNRITDLFRKKKPELLNDAITVSDDGEELTLEDLLPSADAGPEAEYARNVLIDALEEAIEDLPEDQREVFVAHELMGRSFKELSEETGVSVNTLLSRKRYAVLRLRERLQTIHDDFTK
jgi:RNA polymerase sigma factor (sigma-70 family)